MVNVPVSLSMGDPSSVTVSDLRETVILPVLRAAMERGRGKTVAATSRGSRTSTGTGVREGTGGIGNRSTSSMRSRLVRLAHDREDIRSHILPLLEGSRDDDDVEREDVERDRRSREGRTVNGVFVGNLPPVSRRSRRRGDTDE